MTTLWMEDVPLPPLKEQLLSAEQDPCAGLALAPAPSAQVSPALLKRFNIL